MARESLLPSFRHEVDRLFDSLIHSAWVAAGRALLDAPADVAEEAGRYLIRMDLPGVRNSDITVAARAGPFASTEFGSRRGSGARSAMPRGTALRPIRPNLFPARRCRTSRYPGETD